MTALGPLVVVRPEPGCTATVARARAIGLDGHRCPLFAVAPVKWSPPPPESFDTLLLTSANALRHGGEALARYHDLPVWAVGETTAAAAREAGFAVAATGEEGAQKLVDRHDDKGIEILWLCGRYRTAIEAAHAAITALPVYAAPTIDPPDHMARLLDGPALVMVHSARAGARLAELATDRAAITIAAISERAAAACGPGWRHVARAAQPDDDAMLELARAMCQKPPRETFAG